MIKSNTRYIVFLFFVAAITGTGFFVVASYKNLRQTQAQFSRTDRSLSFTRILERIHEHADQLESAQRNFFLSPGNKDEKQILAAEDSLRQDTLLLAALTAADSNLTRSVNNVIVQISNLVAENQSARVKLSTQGEAAIAAYAHSGSQRKAAELLKASLRQLESQNHAMINAANSFIESMARKTTYRFLALAAGFLLIIFYFLYKLASDITKGERVAAKLRYQASLINSIPDAIFTTDTQFRVRSWNKYAEELYGVNEAEALGRPIGQLFTLESTGNWEERLQLLQSTGSFADEFRITKRNGEKIVVMASINTILSTEDSITGYVAVHRDITEQKKLELNQRQFSQELEKQVKLKTTEVINLVERITDGFLAMDSRFTFTYVNARAGEILGHSPASMMGRNIFNDFSEFKSSSFNEACLHAFETQQFVFLENYYEPLERWLENSIYPSPDGLSVFFKDITNRKKTESALKESEERYRHLIEHIHAGVVVHRPDSSILLYNQEAARLLGLKENELTGKTAADPDWHFIDERGKKMDIEEYPVMKVLQTGQPIHNMLGGIENPQSRSCNWVLVNAYPEWDHHNELRQIVVTFVDITNRIKAEEELKRSEDNLSMAQKLAKIGSWEFNMQTQELTWSKELYRIFEFENVPDEELYMRYRNKFHPDDLPKLDSMIQHALETKTGYTYQHRIINNDGSIKHILGIGEVMLNRQGELIGLKGTGQDITELVKAEEKLQHSYRQIRELVAHLQHIREQERTRIAREIHDELGQQLTGLKMYISWLSKKTLPAKGDIQEKFEATTSLIEETIRSVRRISMELRPSMLDDLGLIAAMEWQSNEFEKRSGISAEFINRAGNVEIPAAVKTGLFRIFQESLTNVARHAGATRITATLELRDQELILTISDNGKGFSVSNVESKKTLGLFGMKERTQEMGGKYDIISTPGDGTTVRVIVPVTIKPEL